MLTSNIYAHVHKVCVAAHTHIMLPKPPKESKSRLEKIVRCPRPLYTLGHASCQLHTNLKSTVAEVLSVLLVLVFCVSPKQSKALPSNRTPKLFNKHVAGHRGLLTDVT